MVKISYLKFASEQRLDGVFLEHDTVWNCDRLPQIPGSSVRGGTKVEYIWDGVLRTICGMLINVA
jgi:hypothetical protein